jgi:hypothetical protein
MNIRIHGIALMLCGIFAFFAASAADHFADRSADEAALREIKEVLWPRAYFEQDTELLGRLLAPEFQMVDGDGAWRAIASHVSGYKKTG